MIGIYIEGGLCNRLFQIAFAYSFAKKNGTTFKIENWKVQTHHSESVYEWLIGRFMELVNYDKREKIYYSEQYREFYDEYTHYYPPNVNKYADVFIRGFFQNEKYFLDYKEDIYELFRPPIEIVEAIEKSQYKSHLEKAYFLHVRLGDYAKQDRNKYWVDLRNFYRVALEQIESDSTILLFSNFPDEIHEHYPALLEQLKQFNVIVVNEKDEVFNLYLMSECKRGGICANSSFSWWGSWLNKNNNKKVYMPDKWINGMEKPIQIYPSYATILPVITHKDKNII
jgi:hypothetical protein